MSFVCFKFVLQISQSKFEIGLLAVLCPIGVWENIILKNGVQILYENMIQKYNLYPVCM